LKKSTSQSKSNIAIYDSLVVNDEFFEILNVPVTEITEGEYAIVQISLQILPLDSISNNMAFIVAYQLHNDKKQAYRALDLTSGNIDFYKWNYRKFNYITPEFKSKKDKFITYIYNPGKKKFCLNNIEIKVYEQLE